MGEVPEVIKALLRKIGVDPEEVDVHVVGPNGEGMADLARHLRENPDAKISLKETPSVPSTIEDIVLSGDPLAFVLGQVSKFANMPNEIAETTQSRQLLKEISRVYEYNLGKTGDITQIFAAHVAITAYLASALHQVSTLPGSTSDRDDAFCGMGAKIVQAMSTFPQRDKYFGEKTSSVNIMFEVEEKKE